MLSSTVFGDIAVCLLGPSGDLSNTRGNFDKPDRRDVRMEMQRSIKGGHGICRLCIKHDEILIHRASQDLRISEIFRMQSRRNRCI